MRLCQNRENYFNSFVFYARKKNQRANCLKQLVRHSHYISFHLKTSTQNPTNNSLDRPTHLYLLFAIESSLWRAITSLGKSWKISVLFPLKFKCPLFLASLINFILSHILRKVTKMSHGHCLLWLFGDPILNTFVRLGTSSEASLVKIKKLQVLIRFCLLGYAVDFSIISPSVHF